MEINLKNEVNVVIEGSLYTLPNYKVSEKGLEKTGTGQTIQFVRGAKDDEGIEKQVGIVHENLLALMIKDLQYKNSLVPSRETALVITKLQEAYMWLIKRQMDRKDRGVDGTYKK